MNVDHLLRGVCFLGLFCTGETQNTVTKRIWHTTPLYSNLVFFKIMGYMIRHGKKETLVRFRGQIKPQRHQSVFVFHLFHYLNLYFSSCIFTDH